MARFESVDVLLARSSSRADVRPSDGKAGARFERVVVDGEPYFVKHLSPASDWIMRVTGDTLHRPYQAWRSGLMSRAPASIDHTVVAMQVSGSGEQAVLTMVMRDVGGCLVPEGDTVVPAYQHEGFIEHMADLSCRFWGWKDDIGLTTMRQRVLFFAPETIAGELLAKDVPAPIAAAATGWQLLSARSPLLSGMARLVHATPGMVTEPLAATSRTFLHGDWKMGNLGTHHDGRTILLDWAFPGSGPTCWELCWYLALNSARLPEPKEATIEHFREALEARGVATSSWWDAQLDLCMIAIMATFGWEKALGEIAELSWWERRVADAATRQGIPIPGTAR
jgi:Phosphotransferase enzyme family